MDLVRNTADIKQWANVNASFEPQTLLSAANHARWKVMDILGHQEYLNLVSAYGGATDTTTSAQKNLLPYAQRALVSLAMEEHYTTGLSEVSNSGAHLSQNKDRKNLPADLRKENQKRYQDNGYEALELLLSFLHASTSGTYDAWEASPEKTEHLSLYINTAREFDRYYDIGRKFYLFLALRSTIRDVEKNYIVPILGNDLNEALKTAVLNRSLSPNQQKLLEYIRAAIAPMAIYHGIPKHADKFTEVGLIQNALSLNSRADVYGPSDPSIISLRIRDAEKQGYKSMNDLERFLRENAALYPGYTPPENAPVEINSKSRKTFTAI